MSDDDDGLSITIAVNANGYVEHHVTSDEGESLPAAMMVLYLNPSMPNAMLEYESVAQVFRAEFLERLQEELEAFDSTVEIDPADQPRVARDVAFILWMNGIADEHTIQILKGDTDD